MLILPKGYADWNNHVEQYSTGRFDGRKLRREVGFQSTKEPERETVAPFTGWVLPKHYCPGCDRNDVTPRLGMDGKERWNPGIWHMDEPKPEIGLVPGDVVWFWICHPCMDTENWGSANLQGAAEKRVWFNDVQEKRLERAYDWIKAAISRGDKPLKSRGY